MSEKPTLYDLFGPSLKRWERLVSEGELPTKEQLAEIVEANASEPLPNWLIELVAKALRGELKQRAGRRKLHAVSEMSFRVAEFKYFRLLRLLKHRERTFGLDGRPLLQGHDWWQGPPHERAARMVTARWLKHMNWRSFLNKVSSQQ